MCDGKVISVFVSYSWDSHEHIEKVKKFVMRLRSEGIRTIFDGDIKLGERITHFMEVSISNSDYILYICTPQYKEKADKRLAGVGYENSVISGELLETNNELKFIPILFSGSWATSSPNWAKGKLGVDLSNPLDEENQFKVLIHAIKEQHINSVIPAESLTNQSSFIRPFSELKELEFNELKDYLCDCQKYIQKDDSNSDLFSVIGFCYLRLSSFDFAIEAFEKAIKFIPRNSDTYYYTAISLLKGKRPFLTGLAMIKKIVEYLETAIHQNKFGKYYALLAIIQHDFYEAKKLNNSHSVSEYLALAKQNGLLKSEIEEIYSYLPIQKVITF